MPFANLPEKNRGDWFGVVFALLFPSLITWLYFIWLPQSVPSLQQTAYVVGKCSQFAFPVVWIFLIKRRKNSHDISSKFNGLGLGLGTGLVILLATLLMYYGLIKPLGAFAGEPTEEICDKVADFDVDSATKYFFLGAFYSLVHAFLEEYYWRWFVFGELRRLITVPTAIAISSVGFMAHHVIVLANYFGFLSPWTWFFSLAVATGGIIWAWLYHRTGALLATYISHSLVDAAIFIIGFDLIRSIL